MSLWLKAIYGMFLGAWGGFLAWLILTPVRRLLPTDWTYVYVALDGALVGLWVGALVGALDGLADRRFGRTLLGLVVGGLAGASGGLLGLVIAQVVYEFLHYGDLWRWAGWTLFGLTVGLGQGLAALSLRRVFTGGLGGLLGGLLGGGVFILLVNVLTLSVTSRAVGFVVLGACVGLLIGLAHAALKPAWVKIVSSGPGEGKEFIVDKRVTTIGKDGDVLLAGDPGIAPHHAEIIREGKQRVLRPLQPNPPVLVNGQPITRHVLRDGDRIRIGKRELLYHE